MYIDIKNVKHSFYKINIFHKTIFFIIFYNVLKYFNYIECIQYNNKTNHEPKKQFFDN